MSLSTLCPELHTPILGLMKLTSVHNNKSDIPSYVSTPPLRRRPLWPPDSHTYLPFALKPPRAGNDPPHPKHTPHKRLFPPSSRLRHRPPQLHPRPLGPPPLLPHLVSLHRPRRKNLPHRRAKLEHTDTHVALQALAVRTVDGSAGHGPQGRGFREYCLYK